MLLGETIALLLTEMQQSSLMEQEFPKTKANCWRARAARDTGNYCPCLCKDSAAVFWGMGGSQLKLGAQLPHMAMELNPPSCRDTEHRHKGAGEDTDVLC